MAGKRRSGLANDRRAYGCGRCYTPTPKCPEKIMPGGIFTTNAQLEEYRGVTAITGNLLIDQYSGQPDFSVFDCLTTIGGSLRIDYNSALTSIHGFSALTTIGGDLGIGLNSALTSISEFTSLKTVGGFFIPSYNNSVLTSISGFTSLKTVGGNFIIADNTALTTISGFTALKTVGGPANVIYINIVLNEALTTISGFTALTALTGINGDVTINSNNSVTNALNVCLNTYNAINSAKGVNTFTQTPPAFTTNSCP
jgi:hypothetical protein